MKQSRRPNGHCSDPVAELLRCSVQYVVVVVVVVAQKLEPYDFFPITDV